MNSTLNDSSLPARLRVGGCVIDLASREIRAPGARRAARLTPKAMAVLQALVRQPGQVVAREQLLAEVWPDTLPTNDVVTQAVTQLRKALAEPGKEGGVVIETIAKTGYRLLAPVAWEQDPGSQRQAATEPATGPAPLLPERAEQAMAPAMPLPAAPPAPRSSARRWVAAALLFAVAFASGLAVALWPHREPSAASVGPEAERVVGVPKPPYRLITSSGNFDIAPTLSPDGSMVAYTSGVPERAGTSIMVKTTNNAPPRVLSRPGAAQADRLPAWSPDGREIAFARQSDDGSCRIMLASANGAADERELTRCDRAEMLSFSWAQDGRSLLFGSMTGVNPGRGIRRFDIESGQWHALPYPGTPRDFDYAPQYSPDGRWIAFVRNPQMGDLWLMPAEGGEPQPLTRDNAEIRGLAWLPDSSGIVFGRRVDSQSRLYRIDLSSRRIRDMGVDDAQAPAISATKGKLAFVQRRPQFGIYRFARAGDGSYARERLFASNGRDAQPMVAPSGRQLVFASDRSGEFALWWADLGAPASLRPIDGLVPETRQPPDWSPDSLSLLVVARQGDGAAALYEVIPSLNRSAVLDVPESRPLQAAYLSDPNRILVLGGTESGSATLSLYDRTQHPWKRLGSIEDVSQVRFDRSSGSILFTRFSADGLWRVDQALQAQSVERVDASGPSRWRYRSWAVAGDGAVHYLGSVDACPTLDSILGQEAGSEQRCLDPGSFSAINGFSIDSRSAAMYVSLASEEGSDIGFMSLPHERAGFIGVAPKLLSLLGK